MLNRRRGRPRGVPVTQIYARAGVPAAAPRHARRPACGKCGFFLHIPADEAGPGPGDDLICLPCASGVIAVRMLP